MRDNITETEQQMIKEMVQAMIDNKFDIYSLSAPYGMYYESFEVLKDSKIKLFYRTKQGEAWAYPVRSFNDFILNAEAMKALFGDGYICSSCEDEKDERCLEDITPPIPQSEKEKLCAHIKRGLPKNKCTCYIIKYEYRGEEAYIFHALKAAKLILDGKSGIKYLWEKWKDAMNDK